MNLPGCDVRGGSKGYAGYARTDGLRVYPKRRVEPTDRQRLILEWQDGVIVPCFNCRSVGMILQ